MHKIKKKINHWPRFYHPSDDCLLEFYILATCKVIIGWVLICDNPHSWYHYSAALLGDHDTSLVPHWVILLWLWAKRCLTYSSNNALVYEATKISCEFIHSTWPGFKLCVRSAQCSKARNIWITHEAITSHERCWVLRPGLVLAVHYDIVELTLGIYIVRLYVCNCKHNKTYNSWRTIAEACTYLSCK